MRINNDTLLKIKSTLAYSALPRVRADGKCFGGFQHELDPDVKRGAISGIEAGQWLREDIEKIEEAVIAEMPEGAQYNINTEVLKRFGL
jgi:hypothetical protein